MTRRQTRPQPTLCEAEQAYLARFGQGCDVWNYLGNPKFAATLLEAVERGEPWTDETLAARLGVPSAAASYPPGAIR